MKLLVLHEVNYREKVVYEYQDFAERLASMGHEVSVIDFDPSGGGRPYRAPCSRTGIGEVQLESIPYLDLPILKYLSAYRNFRRMLEERLKEGRVDAVLLYSVFVNGTSAVELCARYRVPVVFRVLDVYHRLHSNRLARYLLLRGERYIYRHADVVSPTNAKMTEYARAIAGEPGIRRVSVLTHGVDTAFFHPVPRDADMAQRYGIGPADRVALFLGTTYAFSGLDALLAQFAVIAACCPQAKILVVGGGELDRTLSELVRSNALEGRVILTGFRPYGEVPALLSLADCCFNSFRINDITRDIIPIKTLQYLACGKPTLSAPIPDLMRQFPEGQSGMLYAAIEEPEGFARALGSLLADDPRRAELSGNAVSFIEAHCAMEGQIKKLEQLLQDASAVGRRETKPETAG